jgi:queuine tRNA-ribosyltransferase
MSPTTFRTTDSQPQETSPIPAREPQALPSGILYMPDATHGVVRAVGPDDLEAAGVRMIMTNSLHLARRPGVTTVQALGGAARMIGWNGPIATDSGGFQAFSLIRQNPRLGSISPEGFVFSTEIGGKPIRITPQKSIQNQLRLGSNLLFCVDDCTHPDSSLPEQELSVQRTIAWAAQCKRAFDKGIADRRLPTERQPKLFAVIQGGRSPELRKRCAEALLAIGFDGYGYGGWPLDNEGQLLAETLALTRELVPSHLTMHALGVGHPASVVACAQMGYRLFDSALPTRDARRGRLYCFRADKPDLMKSAQEWLEFVYIQDEKHIKEDRPLSNYCNLICCRRFSRGYLRHLAKLEDALFYRLATIHNLNFMRQLTDRLTFIVEGSCGKN